MGEPVEQRGRELLGAGEDGQVLPVVDRSLPEAFSRMLNLGPDTSLVLTDPPRPARPLQTPRPLVAVEKRPLAVYAHLTEGTQEPEPAPSRRRRARQEVATNTGSSPRRILRSSTGGTVRFWPGVDNLPWYQ
jgi:hypothetical protein